MQHSTIHPAEQAAALSAFTPLQKLEIARILVDQCEEALTDEVLWEGHDRVPAEGSLESTALSDALDAFKLHLEAVYSPRNCGPHEGIDDHRDHGTDLAAIMKRRLAGTVDAIRSGYAPVRIKSEIAL